MALLRQLLVAGYLRKDIETYGVIKITKEGIDFIEKPGSFSMSEDHSYKEANDDSVVASQKSGGNVADENLFKLLKAERKKVADKGQAGGKGNQQPDGVFGGLFDQFPG